MVNRIQDILEIETFPEFLETFKGFAGQVEDKLEPLEAQLGLNLTTGDVGTIQKHMAYVESWRIKVTKYHAFATAFLEHAKSAVFLVAKSKEMTDMDRTSHQKAVTCGPAALQLGLANTLECIDSRVNLCKKLLGIEADNINTYRKVA